MKIRINKGALKSFLCTILLLFTAVGSFAGKSDSTSTKIIHMIGADLRPGYLFPTHEFFKGSNRAGQRMNSTLSGHLKYGFKFSDNTYLGRQYPHAIQGIGIAYNTFFNSSELGNPVNVYLFQTSRIASITSDLSFDYEWNFGSAFGWKKYDEEKNPFNMVVGSKISAYINLGFLLNWQMTPSTYLRGGVGVTHYSNGNTSYPNSGVNTIGASIGVAHFFGNNRENRFSYFPSQNHALNSYITYDLIVYGATRKKGIFPEDQSPMLVPGSFGIAGLNLNPLYHFSNYFRAGISLDLQYDESANIGKHIANTYIPSEPEELRFYRPP
ncbi:acyloxyacyl hydrolase, partial [Proteiniphilum sp. UBA5510]